MTFRPKRWIVIAVVLGGMVTAGAAALVMHLVLPRDFDATGSGVTLRLHGGDFKCPFFRPTEPGLRRARGIVVLATGDGGWSYWEDNTAHSLATHGYAVMGWDCRAYADSRVYDQSQLAEGFREAVIAAQELLGDQDFPVWYAGWSTGAEQSLAAAASGNQPEKLVGLLLAAPGKRGRYGIATSDLLGITPEGEKSFSMKELAGKLSGVRVAQFAAGLDPLDDLDWLSGLTVEYRVYELPHCLHDMGGAGEAFQKKIIEAIRWTQESQRGREAAEKPVDGAS